MWEKARLKGMANLKHLLNSNLKETFVTAVLIISSTHWIVQLFSTYPHNSRGLLLQVLNTLFRIVVIPNLKLWGSTLRLGGFLLRCLQRRRIITLWCYRGYYGGHSKLLALASVQ